MFYQGMIFLFAFLGKYYFIEATWGLQGGTGLHLIARCWLCNVVVLIDR